MRAPENQHVDTGTLQRVEVVARQLVEAGPHEDLRGLRQHGDRYFAVRVLVATQAEESQALAGFEGVVSRGCA